LVARYSTRKPRFTTFVISKPARVRSRTPSPSASAKSAVEVLDGEEELLVDAAKVEVRVAPGVKLRAECPIRWRVCAWRRSRHPIVQGDAIGDIDTRRRPTALDEEPQPERPARALSRREQLPQRLLDQCRERAAPFRGKPLGRAEELVIQVERRPHAHHQCTM
jgi:hypothetical protein